MQLILRIEVTKMSIMMQDHVTNILKLKYQLLTLYLYLIIVKMFF